MIPLQVQLEATLASFTRMASLMHTDWGWPIAESIHFTGLTLLFGTIAAWDLRLLGVAKQVPVEAFHRLVPFAMLGFAINAASGVFFLVTSPDQYIYNSAFHLKVLCVLLAGANAALFYVTKARLAWLNGAVSLALWMAVIVCGRMITFFRPANRCTPEELAGFIADCVVPLTN